MSERTATGRFINGYAIDILLRGIDLWMIVKCGNPDCREEFKVSSKDPEWECPACSRAIVNRNYPFLTAKLMQAKIDGDLADWKGLFADLIDSARSEIEARPAGEGDGPDLSFLEEARSLLESDMPASEWRRHYEQLMEKARDTVLSLEIP